MKISDTKFATLDKPKEELLKVSKKDIQLAIDPNLALEEMFDIIAAPIEYDPAQLEWQGEMEKHKHTPSTAVRPTTEFDTTPEPSGLDTVEHMPGKHQYGRHLPPSTKMLYGQPEIGPELMETMGEFVVGDDGMTLVPKTGMPDPGLNPAGTAAKPIDSQRDTLSSPEIEGTGKVGSVLGHTVGTISQLTEVKNKLAIIKSADAKVYSKLESVLKRTIAKSASINAVDVLKVLNKLIK